jgi:hypothetical protein
VPAFYLIMDDLSWIMGKLFGRLLGQKEEEPEAPSSDVLAERLNLLSADQADLREKLASLSVPLHKQHPGLAAE